MITFLFCPIVTFMGSKQIFSKTENINIIRDNIIGFEVGYCLVAHLIISREKLSFKVLTTIFQGRDD